MASQNIGLVFFYSLDIIKNQRAFLLYALDRPSVKFSDDTVNQLDIGI